MPKTGLTDMAALMGEAVEAMAAGQAMGLALLKAEMEALTQVLPGAVPDEDEATAARRRLAEDASQEADFDNMPV
jgi:hypothetical protein